jgi:hypothetical protein
VGKVAKEKPVVIPESVLQAAILEYLKMHPSLEVWRMPNGGVQQTFRGKKFMSRSPVAGFPDIFGCVAPSGRLFAFEVKTREGKVSDVQKAVMARLEACGALVAIVRSLQDVIDALRSIGVS